MSNSQAMEKQYSVQFFTTFVSNLQKLCQAYVKFDRNVEVSGYLCVEVDNSKKERYVLSELIQNCGSVVSESYCTKVFRTLPLLTSNTQNAAKPDGQESWSVNPSTSIGVDRNRPKTSQERRGSISSNKSNESYVDIRDSDFGLQSNYSSDGTESLRTSAQTQRSKRLSFDHDKENAARLSRDIIQRLTGESQPRTSSVSSRSWHQVQRQESLPSFAQISSSRGSTVSSSQSSPMEVFDLESVKVEGSRHQPCAQAKPQSVPSSPLGHGDSFTGAVPVGIHANLSNLGHVVEAFATSRTPIAQPAHSSLDRFPRLSSSASISSSQPVQSSSSLHQSHPAWSPPDTSPARSRTQSTSRSQQEVFMQMLPQGYSQEGTKQTVHMVEADGQPKTADGVGQVDHDDVIDLDIDEMDAENIDSSIADVNPSLGMPGMDQSVLSDYMMSSAQATDVQRKRNAQLNCQRYALRLFCEFHQGQSGSMPSLDSISSEQLDAMLSQFYATSKKGNGEDFTVSSLRSIQYYLESHLFENYIQSGSRAVVFKNSRQALRKRCDELRTKHKATPVSKRSLTSLDVDLLFEKGQLGASSPDILLNTLWFMNVMCFGIKGSEHFSLRWGDIILNTDKEGRQFLEYSGTGSSSQCLNSIRVYALPHNQSRCCVYYFKQYLSHRPTIALQPDDPFYLNVNSQYKRVGSWFIKEKVSMSRMSSVWRNMLFAAGLPPDKKTPVGYQKGLLIQDTQNVATVSQYGEAQAEPLLNANLKLS